MIDCLRWSVCSRREMHIFDRLRLETRWFNWIGRDDELKSTKRQGWLSRGSSKTIPDVESIYFQNDIERASVGNLFSLRRCRRRQLVIYIFLLPPILWLVFCRQLFFSGILFEMKRRRQRVDEDRFSFIRYCFLLFSFQKWDGKI